MSQEEKFLLAAAAHDGRLTEIVKISRRHPEVTLVCFGRFIQPVADESEALEVVVQDGEFISEEFKGVILVN